MPVPGEPQNQLVVGNPPGLIALGNLDLNARPIVRNPDGTISTVRSITVTDSQGRALLLPTVIGNRVVSNEAAVAHYQKTGENLGMFKNESYADAYAQQLHQAQAQQYLGGGLAARAATSAAQGNTGGSVLAQLLAQAAR